MSTQSPAAAFWEASARDRNGALDHVLTTRLQSAVATFLREGGCLEAVLFALTFSRVFLCCGTAPAVPRHISPFLGSRRAAAAYPHLEGFIVLDLDVWLYFCRGPSCPPGSKFGPAECLCSFFKTLNSLSWCPSCAEEHPAR